MVDKPFSAGDHVKFKAGGAKGIIEAIVKKEAIVVVGDMRMHVKLRDLQVMETPAAAPRTSSQNDLAVKSAQFEANLDLRGMLPTDALRVLEGFLDDALLTSANSLRIVHGKGNGTLRNLVKNKLREYQKQIKHHHPAHYEGGDGVTVVEVL